jgi:hypothetical protein
MLLKNYYTGNIFASILSDWSIESADCADGEVVFFVMMQHHPAPLTRRFAHSLLAGFHSFTFEVLFK